MLTKSVFEYNKKSENIINKYFFKRKLLKNYFKKYNNILLLKQFYKLPKISMPNHFHNRCWYTGRAHGFIRFFGLSRISLREFFNNGELSGVVKYSW